MDSYEAHQAMGKLCMDLAYNLERLELVQVALSKGKTALAMTLLEEECSDIAKRINYAR